MSGSAVDDTCPDGCTCQSPHPGDWVSFQLENRIVISDVRYMTKRSSWQREGAIVTSAGSVPPSRILECRKPTVKGEA